MDHVRPKGLQVAEVYRETPSHAKWDGEETQLYLQQLPNLHDGGSSCSAHQQ